LAVRCGLNFPWLQYRHLIHGELPTQHRYRTGIYWISLDRDIGYGIKYRRKEKYSLIQHLRPYIRPHVFDLLDWKDMRPFMQRCLNVMKSATRGILHVAKKNGQH